MLATLAPNEIYIYININIHSWNFSDCRVFNYFVFFCQMARETSINNSSVRFPSAVALPLNVPQIEKADFFFRSYSESYFALMINNARPLQMAHSPGTHAMPHVHSTRHNNTQHVRKQLYFVVAVKINNRRRCRRRRRHRRALLYSLRNFTANSFMNSAWPCTRNSFIWMGPCSSAAGTELSLQLTLPKRRRKKHDAVETYNHIGVSFARIRKVSFELWVFLKFFFLGCFIGSEYDARLPEISVCFCLFWFIYTQRPHRSSHHCSLYSLLNGKQAADSLASTTIDWRILDRPKMWLAEWIWAERNSFTIRDNDNYTLNHYTVY